MGNVYLVVDYFGSPLIWRLRDVAPEVRIYQDGAIAESHAELAVELGYLPEYSIIKSKSTSDAEIYVRTKTVESVWFHVFTLPQGYKDKYENRDQGTEV